ncbi:unnamed protein product, partial [Iphiclides podalirius]
MPALWQSSQRPMYIRTVWVDGFRHAILTQDDPHYIELYAKRRRPHSSASINPKRKSQGSRLSHRSDTNCYRNQELIVTSDRTRIGEELEIETLNLTEVQIEEGDISKDSTSSQCGIKNHRSNFTTIEMMAVKTNRTARVQVRDTNELSDRVLQWLDLAGKVELVATENEKRICEPRHSWPTIERRNPSKSRTVNDIRTRECKLAADESETGDSIDRRALYAPTSVTTVENYAKRSRNVKHATRDSATKARNNKRNRDMTTNVAETRQKMLDERGAMEKQYAELVNRKIIQDMSKTKKQVHIFMPESIAKGVVSNANSRTESLLSQKS